MLVFSQDNLLVEQATPIPKRHSACGLPQLEIEGRIMGPLVGHTLRTRLSPIQGVYLHVWMVVKLAYSEAAVCT